MHTAVYVAALCGVCAIAEPAPKALSPVQMILEEKLNTELIALQDRQEKLYAELKNEKISDAEQARRLQEHSQRYEILLIDYPQSQTLLVLFGKFLRDIGDDDRALEMFTRAEKVAPKYAIVQQQIAAIYAERGDAVAAFPHIVKACELAPDSPEYQYQLAEFLGVFRDKLIDDGIISNPQDIDEKIQNALRAAIALSPDNNGYRWRYAESFYDMQNPDWRQALTAWDALKKRIEQRKNGTDPAPSKLILESIDLHRARVLAELGNVPAAEKLVSAGTLPQLEKSRAEVRKIIFQKKQKLPKDLK